MKHLILAAFILSGCAYPEHTPSGKTVEWRDAGACDLPVREPGECDCRHPGAVCADYCYHDKTGETVVHAFCVDGGIP